MAELDVSIGQLLTAANDTKEFQTVTDLTPDELGSGAFPAFIVHTENVFDPSEHIDPFANKIDGEWDFRVEILLNFDQEIDESPTPADMRKELKRLRRAWWTQLDTNVNDSNDDTPFQYEEILYIMGYYGSVRVYSCQMRLLRHTREDI